MGTSFKGQKFRLRMSEPTSAKKKRNPRVIHTGIQTLAHGLERSCPLGLDSGLLSSFCSSSASFSSFPASVSFFRVVSPAVSGRNVSLTSSSLPCPVDGVALVSMSPPGRTLSRFSSSFFPSTRLLSPLVFSRSRVASDPSDLLLLFVVSFTSVPASGFFSTESSSSLAFSTGPNGPPSFSSSTSFKFATSQRSLGEARQHPELHPPMFTSDSSSLSSSPVDEDEEEEELDIFIPAFLLWCE